ncbi:unnamed protein product [Staurois parvus]|uniref:Uncharacterized protein n=1 Tax=Staurois parvus TaxID=386267 RepID=A0ABN9CSW9_9NEOB|nr:unnamed protein product [Staurois parvus]
MRHCKTDSYKHDSQRQRHDGTCSSPTAGGPQLPTPALRAGVGNCGPPAVGELQVPSCLCLWESCLLLSVLQCLMGLVVLQQLEGHSCPPLV